MPELVTKPLSWFKTNPQVRKSFEEAELRALGESLKVKQLQPVLAQPDGTLIAGERRLRAALLVGIAALEVKIADEQLDATKIKLWQLQENKLREDLTPLEEVDGVAEIAALNPQWNGKELAEHLHISAVEVTKMLAISRCPVAHTALADGRLKGLSEAYQIAKAEPDAKSGLLALRLSGATRDEISKAARKPRQPGEKVTRVAVNLPGGVTVTLSGKEMDLEQTIEHLAECLRAAKRARDEGLTAKTWSSAMREKATKGG